MKDKILLFIPAYNCEKQIGRVLAQLDDEVLSYIHRVLIVNNRSTDGTEAVAEAFMHSHEDIPVKLLRNQDNYGLGGSHKVAFHYAKKHNYDYVIVLHGDDQGDIHNLLPVLKRRIYRRYDCCLGARFMRGSRLEGYSAFRTFGNLVYNFLFSAVLKRRVFDLGSGLNLYHVPMLDDNFYYKFPDNLMFNYCMVLALNYYRQKVCFFPITWREDDQVSNVKMVSQAVSVLKLLYGYARLPQKFMRSDHREKRVEEYLAETIAESR